ncbi:hypothetical protein CJD36_009015 [Flavipsychrobacter stenotrophus]|uniref:Uncharacterized protein n=2 Tax=Flavipsychrobacter stenotrophus TaxID=2077091 RepID=A0A2S7SYA1_9BACT|nr:hypothetical protein CJD36_009015 [Flavipsychrobacter stenotrophus]
MIIGVFGLAHLDEAVAQTIKKAPRKEAAITKPDLIPSPGFCNAVNAVMRDAPNKYKNISGKQISAAFDQVLWQSKLRIPGADTPIIEFGAGLWTDFLCRLYISADRAAAFDIYGKYKDALTSCLTQRGYMGEESDQHRFWTVGGRSYRFRAITDDYAWDTSVPIITIRYDSTDYPPKKYYVDLAIWGLERN